MTLGTPLEVSEVDLPWGAGPFPGSAEVIAGASSCLFVLDLSQSTAVKGWWFLVDVRTRL